VNTPMQASARRRDVDLAAFVERVFASRAAQFALLLAISLLTRISTFGDTGYHNDEALYFLIGQRMHDGLLPYVDIWDRKGPGLFLLYYLIAGLSRWVVVYQAAACLFAAATALTINAIAERFAGRAGALLAGSFYLIMLPLFAGGGGQAAVFYNLFMALTALRVFVRTARRESGIGPVDYAAMASAGYAITFKQTAALEGVLFGCLILWQVHRSAMPVGRLLAHAICLAIAGTAPMLAFAAVYAGLGHFPEFWHALVTSNLTKTYDAEGDAGKRIAALALIASPLLLPALLGLLALGQDRSGRPIPRALIAGWLAVATAAIAALPNFIDHYMLPLLLPLAVAAAPALEWRKLGPVYALFAMLFALMVGPSLDFAERRASRQAMAAIAAEIRARDPQPRLFDYQGPVHLYAALGSYPPTPLIFPMHLFSEPERNTSHLDTAGEVRKVLAWRPTVVIVAHNFAHNQGNPETGALVTAYLARCQLWSTRPIIDYYGHHQIDIFGDCGR